MKLYNDDCLKVLKTLKDNSVDCVITSPPYWLLRKYGNDSREIGQEKTFQEYINKLVTIFDEVKRVLKTEGSCWINLSDSYAGNKSLCLIPYRFAIAMIDRGWICRNVLIWYKRNAMPSSADNRFTIDYEPIFFFVKNKKYYFKQQFENRITSPEKDLERIRHQQSGNNKHNAGGVMCYHNTKSDKEILERAKKGRNMRTLWDIPTKPSSIPHFAMYPEELVERMIKAGCPENGIVLDPFLGAGNTLVCAKKLNRDGIGIELYEKYFKIAQDRINNIKKNEK